MLWRAAVRQLQAQGSWRSVDGPLLESYVRLILSARGARDEGQHETAAVAEDRAAARAASLLLTADTRHHAPNGKPHRKTGVGLIEGSGSVA